MGGDFVADDEFRVGNLRVQREGCTMVFYHNLTFIKTKPFKSQDDAKDAFEVLKWALVEYPKKWGDK